MLKRAAILFLAIATLLCAACSITMAPTVTPVPTVATEPTTASTPMPTSGLTETPRPEPTETPTVEGISVKGPACKSTDFKDNRVITKEVAIRARAHLTLTVGSSPSIPCEWHSPEIDDDTVLCQVDRQDKWPAEDVTPMPGAPGTKIWVFQALEEGPCTVSLPCSCLGEEGAEMEQVGTFVLKVSVGE